MLWTITQFSTEKEAICLSYNQLLFCEKCVGVLVVMWGVEGCLVKVGGVDIVMYSTGYSHACSINHTTFCCCSCRGAYRERSVALLLEWPCQVWQELLNTDRRSLNPFLICKKISKWCHTLSRQCRFPQINEDAAHLPWAVWMLCTQPMDITHRTHQLLQLLSIACR